MRILSATTIIMLSLVGTGRTEDLFSSKPIWSGNTPHSGGDGIARFIDVDRDGDPDFLTSAPNPRRWVLFENDGGKFAQTPMWESNETTDCDHIDVLDFNHDGWLDLAGTHESHCTLYFNRAGKFNAAPDWETGIIANANQIDFGDFDQDGDFDMLMAGGDPVNGAVLFENETGTPSKTPTRQLGHTEYSESAIFADFDGDGDLDIVASYRGGRLVVYRNSDGTFDEGTDVFEDKQSPWTQRLYWRDLDRDKQPELFCAKGPWGSDGRSLQLVRQAGTDIMKIVWQSSPQTAFHGFEFQDVDNDGDLDLIAADYGHGGNVSVYLSDRGKLTDTPAWSIKTSGPAHEAVLADIDQDGDLDMAVGCRDQAHIYENLSAGRKEPVEPNGSADAAASIPSPAWPPLEWRDAAPSPFARVESPMAVVDGKMYLFGGFTDDLQASQQVDIYDPASDSWTREKDMPTGVTHLNPASDGKTIWFAGGFKGRHPGPVTAEVWKYDIASHSWSTGTPLPEPRAGGGMAVVGSKLHYFGGYKSDRNTDAGDHWSLPLDEGEAWQREADLPDPRGHVSAAVLDGKMYALGGDHGHDITQIDVASCHRFDPTTNQWSEIASLPDGRSHFESSTIVYQGRIVIVGGRCNSSQPPRNVVNDLLAYDPQADKWQIVGTMPEKLLAPAAAIISGRLVVTGGGLNNPRPLTATTRIAPISDR